MALSLVEKEMDEVEVGVDFSDSEYYSAIPRVPEEEKFDEVEFIEDSTLSNMANRLIERHRMAARNFDVLVLWKSKGGRSAGKERWGQTQKLSGVSRYLSEQSDFVIWIAADHVRNNRITNYQLEAIMFHELQHIAASEDEEGNLTGYIKKHDFEGFLKDIEVYGNWAVQYREVKESLKQAPLIMDGYVTGTVFDE